MSGTSLDGFDMAYCVFREDEGRWSYEILAAETFPYPEAWKERWRGLENASAIEFVQADVDTGHYFGEITHKFHQRHDLKPDFIASHGQTIFHQPDNRVTAQIGRGAAIAAETGLPVVCDFRTVDVALGGQGAPLVPIGDQLLFREYDYCLNLGGFGNISFIQENQRIAFDCCPVNIVLNHLAERAGKPFDEGGIMASEGNILDDLLKKLEQLPYYLQKPPKSLGKEWVKENVFPLLNPALSLTDLLRTYTEHIASQVARCTEFHPGEKMLVTGGGAFNSFLTGLISEKCPAEIVIPDPATINFKEALVFAFLGVLRWRNEINCLTSVTGALKDHCGGAIYLG